MKTVRTLQKHSMANRQAFVGILLYAPAILIILAIVIYPMIYALQMSFTNYRPTLAKVTLVGLKNYVDLFRDVKFWQSLGRSLVFTFGSLFPQIILGLAMASLLNHPLLRWKMLFRGLAITPWLIPTVAVAMIFRWMFHDLYGILNYILVDLGFISSPKAWIAQQGSAMFLLIIANVWRGTPLMITMFLAGLQGIPADLYESAQVDGANAWTRFRKITLPLLMPVIMVSGILRFVWTFNFFDLPWVMTGGGPSESTQTTPIYAFRKAFSSYRMGEGSAITIVLFLILVVFSVCYFRLKKYQEKLYN